MLLPAFLMSSLPGWVVAKSRPAERSLQGHLSLLLSRQGSQTDGLTVQSQVTRGASEQFTVLSAGFHIGKPQEQ